MRLAATLAAGASFLLGMVAGAALQRWGDGVRASGHLGTAYSGPPSSWTEAEDGLEADQPIYAYVDLAGNVYTDWGVST